MMRRPVWVTAGIAVILTVGSAGAFAANSVPVLWWSWWYGPLVACAWLLVFLAVVFGDDWEG
jgi:ABC-type glycerol-3-phosphate transport system substrate-binding protein